MSPDPEALPPPPLSWRVWLLLPLVLVALVGVTVPLWGVHGRDRPFGALPPAKRLPRQPYANDLLQLLEGDGRTYHEIQLISRLHDECTEALNAAGTIPGRLRQRVDRILEKYR